MDTRDGPAALVVLTTLGDAAAARALIRELVEAHLVACGTVVPGAGSLYRWQGAIERADEVLVVLKTRADRWDALEHAIVRAHPYDVPEVLALPVTAGWAPYLAWIERETRREEDAS